MSNLTKISRFLIISSFLFATIIFHTETTFAQHPCDDYPVVTCNIPSSFQNWSLQDNNTLGTAQVGEPRPNYVGDTSALNTLWYSWTPTTSGRYAVTTRFTNPTPTLILDTEIAVYQAAGNGSISNLLKLAHNDDWLPNSSPAGFFPCHPLIPRPANEVANSSCLTFLATAGVKYFFQVDGYLDTTFPVCTGCSAGPFNLNLYLLAPTSANTSISGKVTDNEGRSMANVRLHLTKPNGEIVTAVSNSFGNYQFAVIESGQSYVLQAQSRRFLFENNPRVLTVNENVQNENFVALGANLSEPRQRE